MSTIIERSLVLCALRLYFWVNLKEFLSMNDSLVSAFLITFRSKVASTRICSPFSTHNKLALNLDLHSEPVCVGLDND